MIKSEWLSVLKRPMVIVVLFFITLIPAIYSGVYLSSMWNTYEHTKDLPAAIVNNDTGITDNGQAVNAGKDLVKGVLKSDSMHYHVTSKQEADRGLKNGDYYLVIEIPNHFSKDSRSLLTQHPTAMNITYKVNPGTDFFASQIAKGTATAIQAKLNQQISAIYFKNLTAGVVSGTQGNAKLLTAIDALNAGSQALSTGLSQQKTAITALSNNLPSTAQPLATQLTSSNIALSNAATSLTAGTAKVQSALTQSLKTQPRLAVASKNIHLLSAPVTLTRVDISHTPTNGVGMAPFAIAIGLYVGCISLSFMYDMYSPKTKPTKAIAWWWSKYSLLLVLIGIQVGCQAIVVMSLGLKPLSIGNTCLAMLVTAITFITCVFGLNTILGAFGKYLVTILLILQLGASTGVYPLETANVFTRISSPFLPMTYGIHAMREAISIGGQMTHDLVVMLVVTLVINGLVIVKLELDGKHEKFSDLVDDVVSSIN